MFNSGEKELIIWFVKHSACGSFVLQLQISKMMFLTTEAPRESIAVILKWDVFFKLKCHLIRNRKEYKKLPKWNVPNRLRMKR